MGGNAITFLTKYKNLFFSFKEAVNEISIFAGLQIHYKSTADLKKKNLFFIFFEANNFFKKSLKKNQRAFKYINSRISKIDIISNFEIGFCPGDRKLIDFLQEKGYDLDEIKKTDLMIKNNENKYTLEDLETGNFSNF